MKDLIEGTDYYFNSDGFVVFTAQYHLKKGACCGNGCRHCPYEYAKVPEHRRKILLAERSSNVDSNNSQHATQTKR